MTDAATDTNTSAQRATKPEMNLPVLIQGGMGVAISSWRLARTVAELGQLGVVSGVGIGSVLGYRLSRGCEDSLRALRTFPDREAAAEVERLYFVPGPHDGSVKPRPPEMWSVNPSLAQQRLAVMGAYVEIKLAKGEHGNPVGINLLEKAALPNLAVLYGAMLADVDVVLMGAGIPLRIPGVLAAHARHETSSYPLQVDGADRTDDFHISFVPADVFPALAKGPPLRVPRFLPIVSSHVLAQALLKRADGPIDGFVVELPSAGGHNAPPRGALVVNDLGEPQYGPRDDVDFDKLRELGRPFWLAGRFGSPSGLAAARAVGAVGIQVGTAFAYCRESGMDPELRQTVLGLARSGNVQVRTDARASPTGFPFKVVQIDGSVSDAAVRDERQRVCNIGMLRGLYKKEDGTVGYRCAAEPEAAYVAKGGTAEDACGRVCLCNGLLATAGMPLWMKNGELEPPLITAGDDLVAVAQFLPPGRDDYGAADVVWRVLYGMPVENADARIRESR